MSFIGGVGGLGGGLGEARHKLDAATGPAATSTDIGRKEVGSWTELNANLTSEQRNLINSLLSQRGFNVGPHMTEADITKAVQELEKLIKLFISTTQNSETNKKSIVEDFPSHAPTTAGSTPPESGEDTLPSLE